MAEAKPAGKAVRNFHVEQLEARLKNLQRKLEHRVPHFPEGQREQAKERVERDIVALKKLIAKARKE